MADIAIFRINYKSDFILTLNSDAGWMTPFCIKFWTGAPSQAFFVGWDGTTYTHCSYDPSEPTKLVVQFDDHHLPIGDLKFQIAYHFTVDDFPNDVEDEVLNQSNIVTEIDGNAYQVMLDFTGETAPEIQFSLPAYANEAQRIVNEQQRIAAEETRIDNEAQRIQNEETRINQEQARQDNEAQRIRNEQTRINQEEARVREFATLKRDAQEATTAANNAAALANQKAQLAADKAQLAADKAALAQDAANLANQKAQLAADKAALAQDAADLANQKAQLAQQKAEYAQSQGDYAKQQGDYAKEQGDYAKRKGDDAAAQMQQQAQAFSEAQAARQTSYEQAEGTESGSVAGDGSRWGAFKTNEAARDAKVDAKVADITNLQEAVAEGAVYDVSAKNPTAGPNNDGKWESLSALLSDANLNTLIPSAFRRGGMSIKFVLSSDNKYVSYRLTKNEWSIDTEDWVIAEEGVYVENPEFIYVKTDKDDKILWAIKTDGSIYYGAGVPQQVIDYINERIAELSLDEYEDIVAFLNGLEEGDKTLQTLLNEKVDKEEGKSLINSEYASTKSTIDNPEFLEVTTDSEDKVLEGIKKDGTKLIGGDLNLGGSANIKGNMEISGVSYNVIESPEYLAAWIDAKGKVLFGLKIDGKTYVGDADFLNDIKYNQEAIAEIKTTLATICAKVDSLDIDALSLISTVESPEYIKVELDATGKLLEFTTKDLKKIINKDVEITKGLQSESLSVDGTHFSNVNDIENRVEIKTDKKGSIISYRKSDGTLVENTKIITPTVETKVLKVTDIQQIGIPELTKKEYVYLPKPKYGEFRFYGNLPTDMSDSRTPTELTFIFKIDNEIKLTAKCTLSIQGHGSTNYNKKGYTFEPFNYNGDALEIKFGNMIATDSFHLKAFATDQTHARDIGGYKIWERMINALDYPYNKINNRPFEFSTSYKKNIDATADAQYHPDGFPNVVYLNDEFLGLYTLRLKKTRQNYAMEKSVKSMIFLDATNYNVYEQGQIVKRCSNLSIPFDYRGWDLKNPKLKNYEEGGEIPDSGVLANINRLFDFTSDLENQYENYADFIILPHWLVYIITEELLFSEDCLYNNINLLTWDAIHWSILPYDLDLTYGLHAWTRTLYGANDMNRIMLSGDIFPTFKSLFIDELKALYTKFRKEGIISVSSIMEIYKSQINNIPRDLYEKDLSKWGSIWENGYTSIEHINTNVAARIAYLDSLWLINE